MKKRWMLILLSFCTFLILFLNLGCSSNKYVAPRLIKDSLVFIYPSEARERRIEGTVVLKVLIDEEGHVTQSEINRSSGYDVLDETALRVAETAKFKPAKIEGRESSVWITWPLVFEISSLDFYPDEWMEKAWVYLRDATSSDESKSRVAQQGLYYHYKDFSSHMVKHRRISLNKTLFEVVNRDVRNQWYDYEDTWPLTFILFHDFVYRFPQNEFHKEAESYLIEYVKGN